MIILEDSRERLVIGPSHFQERLGLFFCGIFLLSLSIFGVSWLEPDSIGVPLDMILMLFFYVIAPAGVAGVLIVFQQRKFVFHTPTQQVFFSQGPLAPSVWNFNQVRMDVVERSPTNCIICLVTTDPSTLIIARGKASPVAAIAKRIAARLPVSESLPQPQPI